MSDSIPNPDEQKGDEFIPPIDKTSEEKSINAARSVFVTKLAIVLKGMAGRDEINIDQILEIIDDGDPKKENIRISVFLRKEGALQLMINIRSRIHMALYNGLLHLVNETWPLVDPLVVATTLNGMDELDRSAFAEGVRKTADMQIARSRRKKLQPTYRQNADALSQMIQQGILPFSCAAPANEN